MRTSSTSSTRRASTPSCAAGSPGRCGSLTHERSALPLERRALHPRRRVRERAIEVRPRLRELAERRIELGIRRERVWVALDELALRNRVELVEAGARARRHRDRDRAVDL